MKKWSQFYSMQGLAVGWGKTLRIGRWPYPLLISLLGVLTLLMFGAKQSNAQVICASVPGGRTVGGTISTDNTWCGLIIVTSDITVNSGVTLDIRPGTEIRSGIIRIFVNGTMLAQGTSAKPIIFTTNNSSPVPGQWRGIIFNPSSTGNVLNYVTVEYAGFSFANAIEIKTDSLTMTNSKVQHSEFDGLVITDASPTISNTAFEDNGEAALALYGDSFPILSGLSATSNGLDGIDVYSNVVEQDYTWGNGGLDHYRIRGNGLTINNDSTLTVVPGTRLGFNAAGRITINGSLQAQGTSAQPILFTSDFPTPNPGNWRSLTFNPSSANNLLDHVTVEYGGFSFASAIAIHTSDIIIQNSTIIRNEFDGIRVEAGTPTITQNNIFDNGEYGLRRTGNDVPVPASCNWWGNASGPTVDSNPNGFGQKVSLGVIYEKWLVAPAPGGTCTGFVPRVYLPFVTK